MIVTSGQCRQTKWEFSDDTPEKSLCLRRPLDESFGLLTSHQRFSFEVSAAPQYGLLSLGVYFIGRDVAKRFVIGTRIVVADKAPALLPQIAGMLPDEEVDLLPASPMITFDFTVGLTMVEGCEPCPDHFASGYSLSGFDMSAEPRSYEGFVLFPIEPGIQEGSPTGRQTVGSLQETIYSRVNFQLDWSPGILIFYISW